MRLFLGNKKGKREDNHLTQISAISTQVSKINQSNLMNITEEEYQQKCKNNILNII